MRMQLAMFVVSWGVLASTASADPWADTVVSYNPGTTVGSGAYQADGGVQALGEPSRDTGGGPFASQVGVFSAPYNVDQLTSIGPNGHLTVRFDEPVEDDPLNPFGIDLLVFGNAFYVSNGSTVSGAFTEQGVIEVSQDNSTWLTVPSVFADDEFPTLGYSDTMYTGFDNVGGTILTDFTFPVDPSFVASGLTEAEVNAAYNGSGGGTGVDLSSVDLDWIQYVRVLGAAGGVEIDAFADVRPVPEPASVLLAVAGLSALAIRTRSQS